MKKLSYILLMSLVVVFTACQKSNEIDLDSQSMIASLADRSGENDCFELVYPLNINMPDGSTETISQEADWEFVKKWDNKKGEEFSFQYPLDLLIEGATVTVNSEKEMDEYGKDCFDDDKEGDWDDDKEGEYDKEDCFEIVLPVTIVLPDGTTQSIAAEGDWDAVKAWYENHPDAKEEYSYQYPITISYDDGAKIFDLNSVEELEKLEKDCYEKEDCFKLVYPIDYLMADGSTISQNDAKDWDAIKAWFEAHPDADKDAMRLVYPVDVIFEDGTQKTINNEEEMKKAKDCK